MKIAIERIAAGRPAGHTPAMETTDRHKLVMLLNLFSDLEVEEYEKSIKAGPRRYYFNAAGEIEKIITYHRGEKPTIARPEEAHGRQEDAG